jgi:feruloyl esterase
MLAYVPASATDSPPLLVVLHGCGQTAAAYDHGSGWSELADQHGFVLIYPEQRQSNNPKTCFNWFEPGDTQRGAGEALSIRNMVARIVAERKTDPKRIFITGLSAGGAMANAMLALYPDVFAGGAIIAGLPYGAATNVQSAFQAMFKGADRSSLAWAEQVRAASSHKGPWPAVSVWHGSTDPIVVPSNAVQIVKQWTQVHGIPAHPTESHVKAGLSRQTWRNASGQVLVESINIAGMGHGTPIAAGAGAERAGSAGPFVLDVGISSTHQIARFFGLIGPHERHGLDDLDFAAQPEHSVPLTPSLNDILLPGEEQPSEAAEGNARPASRRSYKPDVEGVITKALKAAGLLR